MHELCCCHPQSSRMAAARFLAIDAVAGHGCRWVYYSDVDMIFFRSESTENKSIVRWHTERMLRTRLGPFDNAVRPEADFLGCGTPAGERLTGLHFVAWEPWIQKVGPCLRTALSILSSQSVAGWCSTRNGFLDEHLLWYSAHTCGVNPGPRMVSTNISVERNGQRWAHGRWRHCYVFPAGVRRSARSRPGVWLLFRRSCGSGCCRRSASLSCRRSRWSSRRRGCRSCSRACRAALSGGAGGFGGSVRHGGTTSYGIRGGCVGRPCAWRGGSCVGGGAASVACWCSPPRPP